MFSTHVMYECLIYVQNANKHIKEKKNIVRRAIFGGNLTSIREKPSSRQFFKFGRHFNNMLS